MALARYWRKNPPVHLLVASYMGWEAPSERPSGQLAPSAEISGAVASPENENAAQALIAMLQTGSL